MNDYRTFHEVLYEAITTTSSYDEWVAFLKAQENHPVALWIERFEQVPQGLKWHPEFELSKHVYLVTVSVHRQGRDDLLEAAFLHDVGKWVTTNIGNDRMYSYGHAEDSLPWIDSYIRYLEDWDLTRRVVEKHMDYHEVGDPRIKNDLHMKEFVKADKKMSTVLFYEFFADEMEGNKAKEADVYRKQRESDKEIIVAIGISGSGKSTYLRKHFYEELIVCPDEIRRELTGDISDQSRNDEVWRLTKERLLAVVEKHGKAVLDATNVDKYRRVRFMSAFNGCRKIAIVFPVDLEEAISRVQKDIQGAIDRSDVPVRVIKRQHTSLMRGLKSLVHEFNEVRVTVDPAEKGNALEILEKINEALKEKDHE